LEEALEGVEPTTSPDLVVHVVIPIAPSPQRPASRRRQ
jgi:hypothetical protein